MKELKGGASFGVNCILDLKIVPKMVPKFNRNGVGREWVPPHVILNGAGSEKVASSNYGQFVQKDPAGSF